ncbi:acetate--CoA ligase family protein [Rhodovarius lipocyclicus]|uniref:acetate--CoA ligase family protein n=1 Tax=Rhodovarius lipocyclicus TaxID=268410 RepID=UPI001359CD4D|nr:acetate--CoA ligase family protein [Rhodovarius lipocyclicus]
MNINSFASLDPLIRPRSIAIVGASDDATRIGGRPIAYMKSQNFHGTILPVNPKRDVIQGIPAYADVAALPEVPDVGLIAVSGDAALTSVEALGKKGAKGVIMFTAGFAEMDEDGAKKQEELTAICRKYGMRLLGPNCLGLFNADIGFYPIFSSAFDGGWPVKGRIGIASQSGAYGTHVYSVARNRGLGTPVCVTTGNEADVALGDVLGWMAQAPEVDVILAYAEGIRESKKFLAALELARANRKPIVMMKVGRSALGGEAAKSHTASIAGDDAVTEAVLKEFGVLRATSTEHALDVAYAATRRIYPVHNTLGVLTVSGGAGVLISDAAEALGFDMPPMPEDAQKMLKGHISFCAPRNPVDCTAQVVNQPALIGTFAESLVVDGGYSSILGFFTQTGGSKMMAPHIRAEMNKVKAQHPDRLWCLSVIAPPEMVREYQDDGFLVFEDPTRAVVALHAMEHFGKAFANHNVCAVPLPVVELPDTTPSEAEAKRILGNAGVPGVPEYACADVHVAVDAAEAMGYPVVLKILSPDILHKSEIGGVILDVEDALSVRHGFETLLQRAKEHAPTARIEGVLVAKQIKGGTEMAFGVVNDPVFGPVAMVGLGGIFIEVLKDVAFRRCPFSPAEAEAMIRSLKGFPLLDGARGRPKADLKALSTALSNLSAFATAAGPRLASVDINPVFALPDACYAADAVLEITP